MKSPYTVPVAIVLGGLIVAVALYVSIPKSPIAPAGSSSLVRNVDAKDHILGNPTARAVIVEYSDFDCAFCKTFNETMHQIIANEGARGDVAWVFRHYPLTEIHPNALSHARAAECAAEVGGNDLFWEFETALFENQPVNPANYGTIAKEVGVPGDAFASCYANSKEASSAVNTRIMADRKNAQEIGAQGTPYSLLLVAGKPPVVINGAYPYEAVKQMIDEALAP